MESVLPSRIYVESSGRPILDGEYTRMKTDNRSKPCYMKGSKKDPMFLYWLHGKWKLGSILDSHRSFAFTKDEPGKEHPCDPSRIWELYDRKAKEYKKAPSQMQLRCKEAAS